MSDRNATGFDFYAALDPAIWRGTAPRSLREAEGWADRALPQPQVMAARPQPQAPPTSARPPQPKQQAAWPQRRQQALPAMPARTPPMPTTAAQPLTPPSAKAMPKQPAPASPVRVRLLTAGWSKIGQTVEYRESVPAQQLAATRGADAGLSPPPHPPLPSHSLPPHYPSPPLLLLCSPIRLIL